MSENMVDVGGKSFAIGTPSVKVYLRLAKLLARLYVSGYESAVRELAKTVAGVSDKKLDARDLEPEDLLVLLRSVDSLEEDDVYELAFVLFQCKSAADEAHVREHLDLNVLVEAVTLNLEQIDLERLLANFRRLRQALPGATEEAG